MTNILDSICYMNLLKFIVYFIYVFVIYSIIRICYISMNPRQLQ